MFRFTIMKPNTLILELESLITGIIGLGFVGFVYFMMGKTLIEQLRKNFFKTMLVISPILILLYIVFFTDCC